MIIAIFKKAGITVTKQKHWSAIYSFLTLQRTNARHTTHMMLPRKVVNVPNAGKLSELFDTRFTLIVK